MKQIIYLFIFLIIVIHLRGQETFPVNGTPDKRLKHYAFINATIVKDYQTTITNASMLIKGGKIIAIGENISIPKNAVLVDLKGKYIYPSFIEMYGDYGIPKTKAKSAVHPEQFLSNKKGAYSWNQALKPETDAVELFSTDTKKAVVLRKLGFGTVLTHQKDGIARGTGALVTLNSANENETILISRAAVHYSFNKGLSSQSYPSSLMGTIALLRQTYLDGQWYKKAGSKIETNLSLEAWNNIQKLPQIIEPRSNLGILRADKIGDEFNKQFIIKTKGKAYQKIDGIKASNAPLIVPINFPKAYDVEDPYDANVLRLSDMKHWEMAPANLGILEKNNIAFVISSSDLKDKKEFLKNIKKAILYGLSTEGALKALTYTPAKLLNATDKVGSLNKNMQANFLISNRPIFDDDAIIEENWVQGNRFVINALPKTDIRGSYSLKVEKEESLKLIIGGKLNALNYKLTIADTVKIKLKVVLQNDLITISYIPKGSTDKIRLSGWRTTKGWKGKGQDSDGNWIVWTAIKTKDFEAKEKKNTVEKPVIGEVTYPFTAYGWKEKPKLEYVLFQNATVWTNEAAGILKETDVLVKEGKIIKIGKNLTVPLGARALDIKGKHLTSGIIDEHSHICGVGGLNECTQAVTAEVRIGDVLTSEDINLYRQLAGGVIGAQILHGSCNPIGGQSGLIKHRWGYLPEEMKIKGADGFIKFALGENVKRTNFGDKFVRRFPQTRMGVEQVYVDAFTRAREYETRWEKYNTLSKKDKLEAIPPRKDLALEAVLEVVNSQRFISCHSYVQSEINMLMKVAEQFGFKINTFTHILEGYKVADKMKAHGVRGASTFSDWWAYKYEVIDAIPYNGAILNKMGITTAFNSDDPEMGRRLNQEAAKAVKYGGVSEEDAWKFVTLNPAKMLHLDHRTGSIKVGKDADLVIWSDHPLSIYAKAEKTYVDGRCFFDIKSDELMREEIKKERNRLVQKMLIAKKNGAATQKVKAKAEHLFHCENDDNEEIE